MLNFNKNFTEELQRLDFANRPPFGLYEPIDYVLEGEGKRLRPNLLILSYLAAGGSEERLDAILPAAYALEFFHNFTLLHDDLMDHSDMRRGRPCVHVRWNEQTAILSGDQLLIEAYKQLESLPKELVPDALILFNTMATKVCEGQQMDMDFEHTHPTLHDYVDMIEGKTGALISCACVMGAYLAQPESILSDDYQAFGQFGYCLGTAFQIMDDYLDCFGTEETLGKPIGGDIREHKKTWLYLMAEKLLQEGKILEFPDAYDILDSEDYDAVCQLYRTLGVDKAALEVVKGYTDQALHALDTLPAGVTPVSVGCAAGAVQRSAGAVAVAELRAMAQNLINRNK